MGRLTTFAVPATVIALGLTAVTATASADTPPFAAGTDAAQVTATIPSIRMDSVRVKVVAAPGGSTLQPDGGLPMTITPAAITVEARPPTTAADLRQILADGQVGAAVLWGRNGCEATRWTLTTFDGTGVGTLTPVGRQPAETLVPGHLRHACTRIISRLGEDEFTQRFAGRTLFTRTRWTTTAQPPVTWSSSATTNTLRRIPLPAPTADAQEACKNVTAAARVRWAWPTATSRPIKGATGIDRWTVSARPTGTTGAWKVIGEADSAERALALTPAATRRAKLVAGRHDILVRGYPFPGNDKVYADSTTLWRVNVGTNRISCGVAVGNSDAETKLGDDT